MNKHNSTATALDSHTLVVYTPTNSPSVHQVSYLKTNVPAPHALRALATSFDALRLLEDMIETQQLNQAWEEAARAVLSNAGWKQT